jgi:hypothetical protein
MSINAILTIETHSSRGADANKHASSMNREAYELGWTQSAFAQVLHQIEAIHGEEALLKILDRVCINPIYSSVD